MSEDNETKPEHRIIEERAYQGDRPTPMTADGDPVIVGDIFKGAYKGERPSPTPISQKPNNDNPDGES